MFENYLSSYIKVSTLLFIVVLTTPSVLGQSPTRLIYTQQSLTTADDRLNTADLTGSFPATGVTLASNTGNFGQPNDVIFDPVNNFIYLVDNTISTGPILRYAYNPTTNAVSGRTVIVGGTSNATYQGLALDVAGNRLYFTQSSADNALDALKVVSGVSGSTFTVTPLATGSSNTGDFDNPNDLVFDPINNYIYMVDQFVSTGPILRFSTNGTSVTNRTVVVAAPGVASTSYGGLALDLLNNKLYVTQYNSSSATNSSLDAIKVVTLSGATPYTPTTVIDGTTAAFTQPTDLVLDRVNNYLYVANQTGSSATNFILRYTTTGTSQTTVVSPFMGAFYGGITLNGGLSAPISLTSTIPADNTTGVSASANIVLNFNRAVSKGTGNFEIVNTSTNTVVETIAVGSVQVTGSGATWTIDPSITLAAGTTYALRATSGIFTASDGGRFAGIADNTTLNFTTNAPPTNSTLTNSSVAENQPVSTIVGLFNTTDPDAGQTFTYSLVSGAGSEDNASFNIAGNQLRTNATFNYEVKNSYSIRVQTADNGTPALTFQKSFTITVTNLNELTAILTSKSDVTCNGRSNGTATVTATGESGPFNYNWRNTTTNTTLAQTGSAVTGLTAGVYSVTVTSSEFTTTTGFIINQPTALSLTGSSTNVVNGNDGTATVIVSGGTPGYSYDWAPGTPTGDGTSTITGLNAGTYTVTVSDANSCTATTSVTVGTVPDLTLVMYARPTTEYGPSAVSVVVNVYEINGSSTNSPITIRVTKDPKITLTFDNNLTTIGGQPVQNSSWTFSDSDEDFYELVSTQSISGGNILSFGLTGTFIPGSTTGSLSISTTLAGGSGGEVNLTNNTDSDRIEYFQQ